MSGNLMFQQRVVYAGLCRMSEDRDLIRSGFHHWSDTQSNKTFDVFDIVAGLVDYLGLGVAEKKALMIGLHAASNKLLDELAPVPPYIMNTGEVRGRSSVREDTQTAVLIAPHIDVTQRYMQLCSQHAQRHDQASFREITNIVRAEGIGDMRSGLRRSIQSWADNGLSDIKVPDDTSVDECKEIAHDFYILLSEIIGPVAADNIVNKVISDVLATEAAQRFSPRELL